MRLPPGDNEVCEDRLDSSDDSSDGQDDQGAPSDSPEPTEERDKKKSFRICVCSFVAKNERFEFSDLAAGRQSFLRKSPLTGDSWDKEVKRTGFIQIECPVQSSIGWKIFDFLLRSANSNQVNDRMSLPETLQQPAL